MLKLFDPRTSSDSSDMIHCSLKELSYIKSFEDIFDFKYIFILQNLGKNVTLTLTIVNPGNFRE